MDKRADEKIKKYVELVKQHIPNSMIVLYGSYARGMERSESDIDIAVVVDDLKDDYLDMSAQLFSIAREVDTSIEPKLVVRKNNRSGFLESILEYGKVLSGSR